MTKENLLILKYQDNFADNLSSIAYGKIFEKQKNIKCCYENITERRMNFEDMASNLFVDYDYVSTNRVQKIAHASLLSNRVYINGFNIEKEIRSKTTKRSKILDLNHFRIDDIELISDDIKSMFEFKNHDFIINHDILEQIQNSNSIGIFINRYDFFQNKVDFDFIFNATKRLNKYLKKPKLFVFAPQNVRVALKSYVDFEILTLSDYREEFYLLKNCKHKIIHSAKNSYSQNFWAAILNNKNFQKVIYPDNLKPKNIPNNWISV